MSPRILIVEDETDLSRVMAYNLRAEGYDCMTAETGEACLREITARRFDLLVLDLMLPDASGLDVIRKLKAQSTTKDIPILIASARGEEIDRVVGLELGADDYVVKPFSVRELVLRVRAILRRSEGAPTAADIVEFG
ncbi:MAG: response regulator, partial [Polyangiales bacterium]